MFFDRLEKACFNKKLSVSRLLRDLGYSTSSTTYWRKGSVPKIEKLLKIAEYLGVPVDYLIQDDARPKELSGYHNDYGAPFYQVRTGLKMDIVEFADALQVSCDTLGGIERGTVRPTAEALKNLLGLTYIGKGDGTLKPQHVMAAQQALIEKYQEDAESQKPASEDEKSILDGYRTLNERGKAEFQKRISEFLRLPEYTEKGSGAAVQHRRAGMYEGVDGKKIKAWDC
jgi:transcriptional regulator with XRE-family HTH domain